MDIEIEFDEIADSAYAADFDDDDIRTDYSGRGMYGDACLGLVYRNISQLLEFVANLAASGNDTDWLSKARQDSMGLDTIVYFPGVKVLD